MIIDYEKLLCGAIDLHVHAGPSVMPRELDGAEMMQKAVDAGYRAFVIKDHYFPTMMSAELVEKHLGNGKVKVYGGIALNDAVGSLNVRAVDVACAMGAKIVWMPTISTKNHIVSHAHGLKFPSSKGMKLSEKELIYVDEQGVIDSRVTEILQYMASTDMILGTGHGTAKEVDALIKEACKCGVKKILVNHPLYMIDATSENIKQWAAMGAYIELNATVFVPESKFGVMPIKDAVDVIKEIGAQQIIIDSDYGQKDNGCPVDGMKRFIELLVNEHGIAVGDIETMIKDNPAKLLGL